MEKLQDAGEGLKQAARDGSEAARLALQQAGEGLKGVQTGAGEKIEKAWETTKEKWQESQEKGQETLQEVKDKVKEKTNEYVETVGKAAERSGERLKDVKEGLTEKAQETVKFVKEKGESLKEKLTPEMALPEEMAWVSSYWIEVWDTPSLLSQSDPSGVSGGGGGGGGKRISVFTANQSSPLWWYSSVALLLMLLLTLRAKFTSPNRDASVAGDVSKGGRIIEKSSVKTEETVEKTDVTETLSLEIDYAGNPANTAQRTTTTDFSLLFTTLPLSLVLQLLAKGGGGAVLVHFSGMNVLAGLLTLLISRYARMSRVKANRWEEASWLLLLSTQLLTVLLMMLLNSPLCPRL